MGDFQIDNGRWTYGMMIARMAEIGDDVEQARTFRDLWVERTLRACHDFTREEAIAQVNSNLGYLLGYGGIVHTDVWEGIGCLHPIFGSLQRDISPDETLRKGIEIGQRMKEKADGEEHSE